jgi:hypothetical protein
VPVTIDLDPATPGQQTTLSVAGQGDWTLDTTNGTVSFIPTVGFVGTATVPYTIQDNYGTTSNQATLWAATQWTAWRLGYQPQLGQPWFELWPGVQQRIFHKKQ